MVRRRKNAMWLWDTPLPADWLFWLTVVGVAAGISTTANSDGVAVDYVLAVVFQLALFGLLPGLIRRSMRRDQRSDSSRS